MSEIFNGGEKFHRSKGGFASKYGAEYTTGQAARILRVSPRTVTKWFNAGFFPGAYRLPTTPQAGGGGDRRIPQAGLIAFCRNHGYPIPTDNLWLACGLRWSLAPELERQQVAALVQYGVAEAKNILDVGFRLANGPYAAVLVDAAEYGMPTSRDLCRTVRQHYPPQTVIGLILTEDFDLSMAGTDLVPAGPAGFDLIFGSSATAEQVTGTVLKTLAGIRSREQRRGASAPLPPAREGGPIHVLTHYSEGESCPVGANGLASVASSSATESCES